MTLGTLFLLAVGLSMDAFAVSISNGICYTGYTKRQQLATAAAFGLFQGLMPVIGYFAGRTVSEYISRFDHVIALILLLYLGGGMVWESIKQRRAPDACPVSQFSFGTLLTQAVATSIDALAVGISLAALDANIIPAACFIAAVTFCFGLAGVTIGRRAGHILESRAQLAGGLILIFIGIKIFVEHTMG